MDGTLVETERLKAISYARAANELCPKCADEEEVVEGFKDVVGKSRQEVAQDLVKRFGLEEAARSKMAEFDVSSPEQAYLQVRLRIYNEMISDPELVKSVARPSAIELLHKAREMGLKTALTTTSHASEACHILNILGILEDFDFIATADDVEHKKPDPEVYLLVLQELNLPANECLAIEDSPPGVQAALSAGLWCIAFTNAFTQEGIHSSKLLDDKWIVDDPSKLLDVVQQMLDERASFTLHKS